MGADTKVEAMALGGGQEVGRSCVLVTLSGKRVLFDCGMHMAHATLPGRFPDFTLLGGDTGKREEGCLRARVTQHIQRARARVASHRQRRRAHA